MKRWLLIFSLFLCSLSFNIDQGVAQEVESKNSLNLKLSGRIQLQHVYNNKFRTEKTFTYHGFRMRRVRFQFEGKLTDNLSGKVQIEARDNSPRLKDAVGKLKIYENYYLRFGQFKVPVWREEFRRSSGDLMLVERSSASAFLIVNLLSARQIGIEFGGNILPKLSFAANYSNGSGEGNSEIEILRIVNDEPLLTVNNGKLYSGRVDYTLNKQVEVAVSGAVNYVGNRIDTLNSTGKNWVIAPDFGIYLPAGIDIEGGLAYGSISKSYLEELDDQYYVIADVTGRWKKMLKESNKNLGGFSGYEIAAGISYIEIDSDEYNVRTSYKFGPALYFAKKTRLQVNAEIVDPSTKNEDIFWRIRSQFTVNL